MYFSFLLTAAIFDLICFCRAYSLAFLLLLNFLFTQGYFISARVKIFYVIAIFFNSVYRVEISTRVENLYIIGPLVELNLRKQKWLIIYNYNPRNTMIKGYLQYISKEIDSLSSKQDNFRLLGDFNSEPTEEAMNIFCQIYNFKNLLDKPTCYKNPTKPSCVDLIKTNKPRSFQNFCTFRNRALRPPQNDPNSTKIRNQVLISNSSTTLILQIFQQCSFQRSSSK